MRSVISSLLIVTFGYFGFSQCVNTCDYTYTADMVGFQTSTSGEVYCFDATGGDFNITSDFTLKGDGTVIEICASANNVNFTEEFSNTNTGGNKSDIQIYGNVVFDSSVSIQKSDIEIFAGGSITANVDFIFGDAVSGNPSPTSFLNGGSITVAEMFNTQDDGATFTNTGNVTTSTFIKTASSTTANSGTITADSMVLNGGLFDMSSGTLDLGSITIQGGDISAPSASECGAIFIDNYITYFSGTLSDSLSFTDATPDDGGTDTYGGAVTNDATNSCYTPLPIELLYFNGELINGVVHLDWRTLTEINNDHFIVERSLDGFQFETLMIMDGAGTSMQTNDYDALDLDPYHPVTYYRLVQVDFDGTRETFPILAVETGQIDLGVYPNPFEGTVEIDISDFPEIHAESAGSVHFEVIDEVGKKVHTCDLSYNSNTIDLSFLPVGVYFMVASTDAHRAQKMVRKK